MIKLIIFDCDGVLVDSEAISNRIDAEMLTSIGYSVTEEENTRKFVGLGYKELKKVVYEESGIHVSDAFIQDIQTKIMKVFETELRPLMLPVLSSDFLKNNAKCVASSSHRERVLASLRITGQHVFFQEEHVFTASQVKNTKPAPDLFLFAAEQMGYKPHDCLVIEDSAAGIEAAHAAGMPVIGFLGGGHARFDWYKQRIQNKNIPIAHNTAELLNILSKHFI
jgi:HAD superfamily hydrolase (TIGR01509 family)